MKKICLILLCVLLSQAVLSQSVNKLTEKRGFRYIKLGNPISYYDDFIPIEKYNDKTVKIYEGNFGVDMIYTGDKYKKIGNTDIKYLFVRLYEGKIAEIKIVCDFDYGLFDTVELVYGKPNYGEYGETKVNIGNIYYYVKTMIWYDFIDNQLVLSYKKVPSEFKDKTKSKIELSFISVALDKKVRDTQQKERRKKADSEF